MSNLDETEQGISMGLSLLGVAIKLWPELSSFLSGAVAGKSDPLSLRIADILPSMSESRQAERELEG